MAASDVNYRYGLGLCAKAGIIVLAALALAVLGGVIYAAIELDRDIQQ